MREGSPFFQKVNQDEPSIPILNVIGVRCDGRDFDGIVKKENVVLDYADNAVFEGNCSGRYTLHSKFNRPSHHPESYECIKTFTAKNAKD